MPVKGIGVFDGIAHWGVMTSKSVKKRKQRLNLGAAVIAAFLIVIMVGGTIIGVGVINRFQDVQIRRHVYHSETEAKGVLLSRIRGYLGYDGLIHNFSLYLANPTEVTAAVLNRNLSEIRSEIASYKVIGVSAKEVEALKRILSIVRAYEKRLELLMRKVAAGESLSTADLPYGRDGQSALVAMATLESIWLATQSSELELVKQTAKSGQELILAALWFVPLLLAVLATLIWFLRHLLNEISARQLAEEEARNSMVKANEANFAKDKFLAAVSHDLRTPLNAIIGFADIIGHQRFGPANDIYQEYGNDIQSSGEFLLSMVNDILDLSAIESGKQSFAKENISALEVVTECEIIIKEKAQSLGIDLETKVAKDLPPLYADRRAIKQILLNLLSNSIKFTPEGGKITLKATVTNEHHTIEVSDTGRGIPDDKIATITRPFVRVEDDPHLSQEGTGLGLAIVNSLVDLHDGKLDIKSTVGKGTSVLLTLPIPA